MNIQNLKRSLIATAFSLSLAGFVQAADIPDLTGIYQQLNDQGFVPQQTLVKQNGNLVIQSRGKVSMRDLVLDGSGQKILDDVLYPIEDGSPKAAQVAKASSKSSASAGASAVSSNETGASEVAAVVLDGTEAEDGEGVVFTGATDDTCDEPGACDEPENLPADADEFPEGGDENCGKDEGCGDDDAPQIIDDTCMAPGSCGNGESFESGNSGPDGEDDDDLADNPDDNFDDGDEDDGSVGIGIPDAPAVELQ